MTVRDDAGLFVLKCDDCSVETTNTTINDLIVSAAMARWKVFNDPDHGVQHFCPSCGQKTEHELAALLRNDLRSHSHGGRLLPAKSDESFSMSLDDVVSDQAAHRAGNVVPDQDVINRKVKEDGEFAFGFSLEDDD